MAIILAAKTGLWTDPTTWIGGVVPGPGDVVLCNGFNVLFDANVTVAELRRDTTGGATAGGQFIFSTQSGGVDNVTLIADVYASNVGASGRTLQCGTVTTATIIGTIYGNDYGPSSTGITAGIYGAVNASTGTLHVYRTVMGARGMPAVSGPFQFINPRAAQQSVRATGSLTEVILRDVVGWTPDPSDVLIGTEYGSRTGIMVPVPQRQGMSAMAMSGAPFVHDVHIPESFSSGFSDAFA